MAEVLNVEVRDTRGSQNARRMRRNGKIPAILYGHGTDCVALTVPADELNMAIRHGARMVELKGAVDDSVFLKSVQWDAFGNDVLHLDLARVKKGEKVEVKISVELRGDAPGSKTGGVVDHMQHAIEILCPVTTIPDKIQLNINNLELDQTLTAADLELPEGASLMTPDDTVIVSCHEPKVVDETEAAPADGAEPEVIGGRKDDAEGGDE